MKTFSFFLFVLLVGAGCSPRHDQYSRVDAIELQSRLSKPETIDFPTVQRLVFQQNCSECHNPVERKDGLDLSTYESIVAGHGDRKFVEPYSALNSSLYTVLIAEGNRHMPPLEKPQLTADQKTLVYLWLENGAKSSPGTSTAKPPSLKEQLQAYFDHPENIDYGIVKKHVLGFACMKCHSLNGDAPDEDAITYSANMTSYKSLFNPFTPVVVKGRPDESKIFRAAAVTQSMPPAKEGYDPIDSLRIKLLRLWILNCSIEDKKAMGDETLNQDPDNPEKVRNCEK